jgi:malate dehydrogenase
MQKKRNGAEKAINILQGVTEREKKLLEACTKGLKGNIEKGIEFVKNTPPK